MGTTARGPKQWSLSKNETINSFENWRQNLVYTLSLDTNFAPFLADSATWAKKTKAQPLRGFTDDGETVPLSRRKTARQKVNFLDLMLGQIANYCPVISRNTLLKNSTSIQSVWNILREHFGFQITGAHFLDALHSLQNSMTLSLAANLTNRFSGQMTSEHHSATPKPPCPLPTPSRSPDLTINCGL